MKQLGQTRLQNGYVTVYRPEHPKAMRGTGYSGFVFEHVLVAEMLMGRQLRDEEVVHHLDGDRGNNRPENLLVLERGQHNKLHAWLTRGAPFQGWDGKQRVNSGKPKRNVRCEQCGTIMVRKGSSYCTKRCAALARPKKAPPPEAELRVLICQGEAFTRLGKHYGVSDNTVRKWARAYGISW